MSKLWRPFPILLLALAIVAVAAATPVLTAASVTQDQSSKEKMIRGELVKVDTEHMTLTIKDPSGTEIEFQYNTDTKVEGSTNGVQGLSTQTGTHLAVHYVEQTDQKLATRIEITKIQ